MNVRHRLLLVLAIALIVAAGSVWAQGPIAAVSKTVGTLPPPVCPPSSSITVPAGTTVYYCYSLTNNEPTGAQIFYNLSDDILGPIGSGPVAPGETVFDFASLTAVNADITNVATWELANQTGTFQDSAFVQVGGVQAIPTVSELGLVALGLALLAAAWWVMRRRRTA